MESETVDSVFYMEDADRVRQRERERERERETVRERESRTSRTREPSRNTVIKIYHITICYT